MSSFHGVLTATLILQTAASQETCRTGRTNLDKKVLEAGLAVACRIGSPGGESVSVGIVGAGLVGQEVLRQLRALSDTAGGGLGPCHVQAACIGIY